MQESIRKIFKMRVKPRSDKRGRFVLVLEVKQGRKFLGVMHWKEPKHQHQQLELRLCLEKIDPQTDQCCP